MLGGGPDERYHIRSPERLLRASLLQAFYTVRSERQLMEQINYNLLFRLVRRPRHRRRRVGSLDLLEER
jgi:transposase